MTALVWTAAGAVLAPALFGAGFARLLGLLPRQGLRLFVGWSYLLGHFVLAHVTLLWLMLGQPVPGWTLPAGAALLGGAILWRRGAGPARPPRARGDLLVAVVTLALCVLVVDACLLHDLQPVMLSDEADIWAAKAKVLYAAPRFDLTVGLGLYASHADYPLFDPLAQVLAFATAGRVLLYENRLPVQGFAVALLLLLSAGLQRRCSAPVACAALCAFTASSFRQVGVTCYADVMLACAVLAAADAWLRWQETGAPRHFRLACFALAAALATKNEGMLLALAAALALGVQRLLRGRFGAAPRLGFGAVWLCVPLSAVLVHRLFNAHFALGNDLLDPAAGGGLFARIAAHLTARIGPVAAFYGRLLLDQDSGRLLLLLCLGAAALRARRLRQATESALLFFVLIALAGYVLVFVGTLYDLQWHLQTAADRTVLHVLPVATLALCIALGPYRVDVREVTIAPEIR